MTTRNETSRAMLPSAARTSIGRGMRIVGRCLVSLLALTMLIGSFGGGAQAAPAQAKTMTICANAPFPKGYVIIEVGSSTACTSGFREGRIYTIRLPANNLTICVNSPFPKGYVITANSTSTACTTGFREGGTYTIRLPANNLTICANSPIPAGYVIARVGSSTACTTGFREGRTYMIRKR